VTEEHIAGGKKSKGEKRGERKVS